MKPSMPKNIGVHPEVCCPGFLSQKKFHFPMVCIRNMSYSNMSYFFFWKWFAINKDPYVLRLAAVLNPCSTYWTPVSTRGSPSNLFLVPGQAFRTAYYYQLFKKAHCRLFYREVDICHDQMDKDFSEKQFVASVKRMLKILSHWEILRKTYKGCRM